MSPCYDGFQHLDTAVKGAGDRWVWWLAAGRTAGDRWVRWLAAGWTTGDRWVWWLAAGWTAGDRWVWWLAAGWTAGDTWVWWLAAGWTAGDRWVWWLAAGWPAEGLWVNSQEQLEFFLFPKASNPELGPFSLIFSGHQRWSGRGVNLTTHIHLVPRLWMSGAVPSWYA